MVVSVVDLSFDETLTLDAIARDAQEHGRDRFVSADRLLETTELSRPALIETVEALEAAGHLEVLWNLNGTFRARLPPRE